MKNTKDLKTEEISKSITIMPKFMRNILGTFRPEFDIPLKKNEIMTLLELNQHPDMPMKHYVDIVDIESGSFTYLADKLQDKGLIKRIPSGDDKRKTVLSLTDSGKKLSNKLEKEFFDHVGKSLVKLDESDLDDLKKAVLLLEKVINKLENN
jgi:MarR family 2-MHQ and catechol resistance regulon transcriptional repressor